MLTTSMNKGKNLNRFCVARYPLLSLQQGILYHSNADDNASCYLNQVIIKLPERVNVRALELALQAVLQRHDILRASVAASQLQLHISNVPVVDFQQIDFSEVVNFEQQLQSWLDKDKQIPFDLSQPSLIRFFLIKKSVKDYRFVITYHHTLLGASSTVLFVKEIFSFYDAFLEGKKLELNPPKAYRDCIAAFCLPSVTDAMLYWQKLLAGYEQPLQLPELSNEQLGPAKMTQTAFSLSPAIYQQLISCAKQHNTTLNSLMQLAWGLLLAHYGNTDDVVFGVTREFTRRETRNTLGLFLNTLPVRLKFTPGVMLAEQLEIIKQQQRKQIKYLHTPLTEIQQCSELPAGSPLFSTLFDFKPLEPNLAILKVDPDWQRSRTGSFLFDTHYPLLIEMYQQNQTLAINLHFNTGLFEPLFIEQLFEHYQNLLGQLSLEPAKKLLSIPLLTKKQQNQLMQWNTTDTDYMIDQTIHQLVTKQSKLTPDGIAVSYLNDTLTYRELEQKSDQFACYLQQQGVTAGMPVVLYVERNINLLIAIVAIMKTGGYYVPIDPTYPSQRIATVLQDCVSSYIVTESALIETTKKYLLQAQSEAQLILLDQLDSLVDAQQLNYDNTYTAENTVYVMYTSGSTGKPKGVCNSHQALVNRLTWMQQAYQLTKQDRVLHKTSIGFDVSFWELFWPLIVGAQVVIAPRGVERDANRLVDTIQHNKITHLHFVPSALSLFLKVSTVKNYPSLKQIFCSGEALLQSLAKFCVQQLPSTKLTNLYGPTEAAIDVTYWDYVENTNAEIPIGKPIANAQAYVLNYHNQIVGPYLSGELYIGGVPVAQGYLNQPERTAENFVNLKLFSEKQRVYKTGDHVRWLPDGNLLYLSRMDEQIKLRGFRIEPGEIEYCLRLYPGIEAAFVIIRGHDLEQHLVAYFTASTLINYEEIQQFLSERLPSYMLPTNYQQIESVPLTSHGKINKKALAELEVDCSVDSEAKLIDKDDPIAQNVMNAWKIALNLSEQSRLSQADNFFNLGGNSLTAMQTISCINQQFAMTLKPNMLFDHPTLQACIDHVRANLATNHSVQPLQRMITRPKKVPLSFAQQRLWFLDQLHPNQTSYNLFIALEIKGKVNISALQQAFDALVLQHDILRTTFHNESGEIFQVVHQAVSNNLVIHNAFDFTDELLSKYIYEEAQTPFNLSKLPLIRATLLSRSDAQQFLLLTVHHIISDGWSMNILAEELSRLYAHYQQGQVQPQQIDPRLRYTDYAMWSRKQFTDSWLQPQLKYWEKQLAQLPILNLPTDYARANVQQLKGKRLSSFLNAQLSTKLKQLATKRKTTLFNVLLSAFSILLARYSGQLDIALGTPIAGRHYPETENLIGLFVNMLVLRPRLKEDEGFFSLLVRNHQMLSDAYANQDVPFEKLVELLSPSRDMSRHPLCQVMIVMQNFAIKPLQLAETQIERVFGDNETLLLADYESSKFDLTLYLQEKEEGLQVLFEYDTSLFLEDTIQRLSKHFNQLLQSIVASPDKAVLHTNLLTEDEQQQLVIWNNTEKECSQLGNILDLFEQQVKNFPQHVAILFKNNLTTYQQLNTKANQLAHYLCEQGVTKNSLVGVYIDRSIEMIVSILAILKTGAAYVPVDTESPKQRLNYVINDSGMVLILCQTIYQAKLEEILAGTATRIIDVEKLTSCLFAFSTSNLDIDIQPDDFSYVIYTSGSTGKPKGVINQHRGTLNRLAWMQDTYQLTAADRVLQKTSISFDVSVWEIFWPLITGSTLVLAEPELHKDVDYLVDVIKTQKVTVMHFVPSMLSAFLLNGQGAQLTTLKHVMVSGEELTRGLQQQFFRQLPQVGLHNLYGPTEASIDVTYWQCTAEQATVPIGKPIHNTKIYIVDQQMNLVPVGVTGEICIAGECLAWGYLNQPALTQERFINNPFNTGDKAQYSRLYRTGDLGRWLPEGKIAYLGRIDRQIKLRGFRVEPAEIEAALMQHAVIKQAAITYNPSSKSQQLTAYIMIEAEGTPPTFEGLFDFLTYYLPHYMVPTAFFVVENLPLMPNGKMDWQRLPTLKTQPLVAVKQKNSKGKNDLQNKLAAIWAQCLAVVAEDIDIHHNFFELGGHSLLALKIIVEIEKQCAVKINTQDFFQAPTIAQLSLLVQQKQLEKVIEQNNLTYITKPDSPVVTLQPQGDKTPIFLFHPVGGTVFCYMPLVSYLKKDRPCYAIQDPGIEASQPLYKTLEEMTTDYLELVKEIQPQGPYILGGSSFGGTVAVEMAHQLSQKGEKAAFLPLLDLWALFTDEFRSKKRLEAGMLRQFEMLKKRLDTENILSPEPWLELNWHRMNLWMNYKPPVVDAKLTVFKARDLLPEYIPIDEPTNHWQKYSTCPVDVKVVPGDHETMHLEPNAKILGELIQQYLDNLD